MAEVMGIPLTHWRQFLTQFSHLAEVKISKETSRKPRQEEEGVVSQ